MESQIINENPDSISIEFMEKIEILYYKLYNSVFISLQDFINFIFKEPGKKDIFPIIEKFATVVNKFSKGEDINPDRKRAILYELLFAFLLPNRDITNTESDEHLTKEEKLEIINLYRKMVNFSQLVTS
ncbi:MAG: hypothetical protein Q8903_00540 [Bacteroidota bacterium]|nr:hypothetical protein [Bacteroidota bacterium]